LAGTDNVNAGRIYLQDGTLDFHQSLTNQSTGQILGRGTLMTGGIANQGHIALSSGITDVFGDVSNNTGSATRGISVSGNADVTFWDDVTNVAGSLFRVSSGSSATFFGTFAGAGISGTGNVYFESDVTPGGSPALVEFGGDVKLGSNATLQIELGGTTPGTQHDKLNVASDLALDGALEVSLINGFIPSAGQSFNILDWGSLAGTFSSLSLPTLAGLAWNTSQLYTTGVLSLNATGLPGDFNNDGVVNAADYIAWRKGIGVAPTPENYNLWRTNFGRTTAGGASATDSSSGPAVPELGSAALVAIAISSFLLDPRIKLLRRVANRTMRNGIHWRTLT
jgi:hypothetical protein